MAAIRSQTLRQIYSCAFLLILLSGYTENWCATAERDTAKGELKAVSQCFNLDTPFSFVSLYCGYSHVIQIRQAFHGSHKNHHIKHCSRLPGDCIRESTQRYNWVKCQGQHSCVQVMKLDDMPRCETGGEMQYLQVEYTCTKDMQTIPTLPINVTKPVDADVFRSGDNTAQSIAKNTNSVHTDFEEEDVNPQSICSNYTEKSTGGTTTVVSPGYPDHYLANVDCRCIVQAQEGSQVSVTYKDLGLVMRDKQCVDWLLIQSLGHKVPAAVTCGQLNGKSKTLVTHGNWALLHFHTAKMGTDGGGTRTRVKNVLPGFKINIHSQPNRNFKIQCYTTHPSVLSSLRYKNGKHDVTDDLVLPASDLEALARTGDNAEGLSNSNKSKNASVRLSQTHIIFLILFTILVAVV